MHLALSPAHGVLSVCKIPGVCLKRTTGKLRSDHQTKKETETKINMSRKNPTEAYMYLFFKINKETS